MKHFLGSVNQFLQSKNKLEKAVQDFIKQYDRELVPETKVEDLKELITKSIIALNVTYGKCTPLKPCWWTPAHDIDAGIKDWVLGGVECVRFSFHCSKEVKLWV